MRPAYPAESWWNLGSTNGSRYMAATVCAIRSAIVGTPSTLTPGLCGLGISTALTGGGNQVPELIRSGRPGESHPRAPTDPGVTVSRHRALLIQSSRRWSSIASG